MKFVAISETSQSGRLAEVFNIMTCSCDIIEHHSQCSEEHMFDSQQDLKTEMDANGVVNYSVQEKGVLACNL